VSAPGLRVVAAVTAACLALPAALLAREPAKQGPAATSAVVRIATGEQQAGISVASTRISTSTAAPARRSVEASASATVAVTMGDYFYRPRDATVSAGDSVTWTNKGKVPEGHTATGQGFDSGILQEGETYTHRFDTEGTFDYVCTLHPNMRGTVTVTGSTPTGGGGGGGGEGSGTGSEDGGSTTSDGSGGVPAGQSGGDGGSLPTTGLDLILLAEIGMLLLAAGALLRKLLRA
jgi:plastocyanin